MEDLISTLIFVGTFVIFIISAMKKQKKNVKSVPASGFESIAEKLFPDFQFSEESQTQKQHVDVIESSEEVDILRKKTSADKDDAILNNIEDSEKAEVLFYDDNNISDDFDLRKAIIYSEIINRKY